MLTTTAPLPVIIRTFRDGGDTIAFFPTVPSDCRNWYNCESYQSRDGHGGADYTGCVSRTRRATPGERADMLRELRQRGYTSLRLCFRETCYHRAARQLEYQRWLNAQRPGVAARRATA